MSLVQVLSLSIIEIIGDVALKEYANDKGLSYLGLGIAGYIGVVIMLVVSLQDSTLLMVNNGWDGTSSLLESIYAYVVLGERFDNYLQYFGVFFIIVGLYLLKIPLSKTHPFHIPK
uniref:EamA domain-containing protein n=1 Tax=viral metagenome TaxID=1070528 RepID=A0A6C0I0U2_9ZZZZ